jgi:hypothetical protein
LCDELALSLSFLLLDLDDCDLGDGGIETEGVGSMRDGDLESDLAGELCLLVFSRLLDRFSTLGDALADDDDALGVGTGLPLVLVAVLRLMTELDCCLFLEPEKNRLSLGVL